MTRKEYLLKQKQRGKTLFGVFPAQYPKELLWAMNILPVEIWDPPMEPLKANSHLQAYICSVAKLGLELILQGKADFLDGFLFPHTCDSIQNMASVVFDYIGLDRPCYFFYHPKEPYSQAAEQYYLNQLTSLVTSLGSHSQGLDKNALMGSIHMGERITQLLNELYKRRASGELPLSNREFYSLVRKGEYMWPEHYIDLLEKTVNMAEKSKNSKNIHIILSGVLPNPPELLDLFDQLNVCIAHDDLLNCSRRLLIPEGHSADPFERLKEKYFAMPPCSTRGSPIFKRKEFILNLVRKTGAKGVVFNIVKFCEPEWFDLPNLAEELKKQDIPTLVIDTELNQGLSGQVTTRVEAFVEML